MSPAYLVVSASHYSDLARLGYVSRARITQIMNLLNLAPDIQEEILTRSVSNFGCERNVRRLVSRVDWSQQRQLWGVPVGR